MYVRVTRGQYDPKTLSNEQMTGFIDRVTAAVKDLPGFVSFQSGLDRQAGAMVAISTWEDEGSANFKREALGSVIAETVEAGLRLEPPQIYEVTATA